MTSGLQQIQANSRPLLGPNSISAEVWSGSCTRTVDIWAVGVIGVEYLIGLPKRPKGYRHGENSKNGCEAWSKKLHSLLKSYEDPAIPLLTSMLEPDPQDRPSAKTCASHSWFQGFQMLNYRLSLQNRPPAKACAFHSWLQDLRSSFPNYSNVLADDSTEILTEVEESAPMPILFIAPQQCPRSLEELDPKQQEAEKSTSKLRNASGKHTSYRSNSKSSRSVRRDRRAQIRKRVRLLPKSGPEQRSLGNED